LVNEATRNDNVLDILLVNEPNTVFDVHVGPPFGGSDHCCVNFTVVAESTLGSESPNDTVTDCSQGTKRYRWKDANYAALADYLSTYDWNHLFSVNLSVDLMWSAFCSVVREAIDVHVPVYSVNPRPTKKRYTKKICKAAARKNCLWRKSRSDPNNNIWKLKYGEAARQFKEAVRSFEISKEKQVIENNNLGSFYKHINNRLSCRSGVGVLHGENGEVATSDTDKASVLNNYFSSVCTNDDGVLPEFDRVAPANVEFNDVMFSPANVKSVLRKLKNKVSCGLDGLPPTLFKKLAPCLAFPLSVLY